MFLSLYDEFAHLIWELSKNVFYEKKKLFSVQDVIMIVI